MRFLLFLGLLVGAQASNAATYTLENLQLNQLGAIESKVSRIRESINIARTGQPYRLTSAELDREICAEAGAMNANAFAISSAELMNEGNAIGSSERRNSAIRPEINDLIDFTSGITNRFCSKRLDGKLPNEVDEGDYRGLLKQLDFIVVSKNKLIQLLTSK